MLQQLLLSKLPYQETAEKAAKHTEEMVTLYSVQGTPITLTRANLRPENLGMHHELTAANIQQTRLALS